MHPYAVHKLFHTVFARMAFDPSGIIHVEFSFELIKEIAAENLFSDGDYFV